MAVSPLLKVIRHVRDTMLRKNAEGCRDGALLTLFIEQKDEAAFEALMHRHGPMVLGVCRRLLRNEHDAEDAFQATFLVLVRKASSVRPPEMIGNWLYGVAFRTSLAARRAAHKRHAKEAQVARRIEMTQYPRPEPQPVLDQAMARLPDTYRTTIVLCDLEGKTRQEAARQLGLPEGTVASRLARARLMLAKQLSRLGVTLPSATLAVILSQDSAGASLPTSLVISTLKAAKLAAAGKAMATVATSAEIWALTEGVLRTMLLTKLKIAGTLLLAGSITASGSLILAHGLLALK